MGAASSPCGVTAHAPQNSYFHYAAAQCCYNNNQPKKGAR